MTTQEAIIQIQILLRRQCGLAQAEKALQHLLQIAERAGDEETIKTLILNSSVYLNNEGKMELNVEKLVHSLSKWSKGE